jgi:hypothetical protein
MMNFDCLFYFSSDSTILIEIKRLDLAHSAPLSDVYKWLVIENQTVRALTFVSMNKFDAKETREFSEGELSFDSESALLNLSGKEIKLDRKETYHVSPELIARISNYLR